MVVTKRFLSPETEHSALSIRPVRVSLRTFGRPGQMPRCIASIAVLPFRLAAGQLLYLRLFRTARIIARLERVFCFPLFARGAFGFFAVFFAEFRCICHECFLGSSKFCNYAIE